MIRVRKGKVISVSNHGEYLEEVIVELEGNFERAVNYPQLTGPIKEGDEVILNTSAVYLGLGTGGVHYVLFNYSNTSIDLQEPGHIMKMRYTPLQIKCLCAEEKVGPLRDTLENIKDINAMPVIACSLHSMIAPALAAVKRGNPKAKIAYIMTDGAALPIYFSRLVAKLKEHSFIDVTITVGHAFGGDLEAVNLYSGLICAKAWGANAAIVAMGPGIVGTGTKFGHTGLEQGEIINAIGNLGGYPVAIPRISFADKRLRHRGLSHHTQTALSIVAKNRAFAVIPSDMNEERRLIVEGQLRDSQIPLKHSVIYRPGLSGIEYLREKGLIVTTMGRNIDEDWDYFLTCSAAGNFLTELL